MWTTSYKGYWIHGYIHKKACQVQTPTGETFPAKSLYAAKHLISRHITKENKDGNQT